MIKPYERRLRLNNQIRVPEVSVIDAEGKQLGVMQTHEALRLANESGLDLVEVGPDSKPPVVKIIDYGKFTYQQERREKGGNKNKSHAQESKTVQVGFRTGIHDLIVRAGQADKFLKKGYRVRIDLRLRGREKGMQALGRVKLEEFKKLITEPFIEDSGIKGGPSGLTLDVRAGKK
ncbi:MAG: translation initiation factor IF-3 [Candidatus Yanofskybacteria bacterium RIFCSPLOWO2_01_FULL_49_25]|uniref:Translation initiation factor IF-3 n=1 Tax=Candidatus Yanofskybacteria bacterium RIFCSPLOWO2_01_FULL_49_25 TaxID=1802701 RepID=A0A1F8GRE4_9BACT|nr:MAG: translation initiation factor IF-3 [Candidatus Yanofskybacteria bacterium RIFCSPLOWO2_01_FULL_49_25]